MSASNTDSEMSEISSDSFDGHYSDCQYVFQEKPIDRSKKTNLTQSTAADKNEVDEGAYQNEPIANAPNGLKNITKGNRTSSLFNRRIIALS